MSASLSLVLLLAFALSLDTFCAGLSYGLRKMTIPLKWVFLMSPFAAGILLLSMLVGQSLESFLSPTTAEHIGGTILIALGTYMLYQFFRPEKEDEVHNEEKILLNFEIKSLGYVINILKRPLAANFGRSGTITGFEAIILGIALSLDGLGAGIAAAFLGYPPLLLSGANLILSFTFTSGGVIIGKMFNHIKWIQHVSFIPGILLILLGLTRFF